MSKKAERISEDHLKDVKIFIYEEFEIRDKVLFEMLLNTGRRSGDISRLKKKHILYDREHGVYSLNLLEQKTSKLINDVPIKLNKISLNYLDALDNGNFLFPSRHNARKQTGNLTRKERSALGAGRIKLADLDLESRTHITTAGIDSRIKRWCHCLPNNVSYSAHSFRKYWARKWYEKSMQNIELVQELLNHSSQKETLAYIGLRKDERMEIFKSFLYEN